jgi:prepilin-type N-terminal cleavage/methylation domain-containing protein/prepilin-type processing-associated H-X9-DG protein
MRKARGFTLVELLVVIGIIALLISILMPALSNARRSANTVKCLSNIRQIGVAVQMYAGDYKGTIPVVRSDQGNPLKSVWWMDLLAPYATRLSSATYTGGTQASDNQEFQNSVIFGCTEYDPRTDVSASLTNAYPGYAFAVHVWFKAGQDNSITTANKKLTNSNYSTYPGRFYKQSSITSPAERMMIADSNLWLIDARQKTSGGISGLPGQPLDWKLKYAGYTGQAGQMDVDMYRHVKKPTPNSNGFFPVSAKGACNVVFFDGHGATLTGLGDAYHAIFMTDPPQ